MSNPNLLQGDNNLAVSSDPFMVHVYCKQYIIVSRNYCVLWYRFYCVCEFLTMDNCDGRR